VRLLDGDVVAGLGLPLAREGLVEVLVQLARRIVGHVQQGNIGSEGGGLGEEQAGCQRSRQLGSDFIIEHRYLSFSMRLSGQPWKRPQGRPLISARKRI
jgi:hypothetical protein